MIADIISQLSKFSPDLIELNGPISEAEITNIEKKLQLSLPNDYKVFLTHYNGISLMGTELYGIENDENSYALEKCFQFEHFEVDNPMPLYLVPFSPDGGGNHYCFDTRHCNEESCNIVFWQHDYFYSDEDKPEVVNFGFLEWVQKVMIDWTLESYDFEGNEK